MGELWTIREVSEITGISEDRLHQWHRRGYLPYAGKKGRASLVRLDDVFRVERERRPGRPPKRP